MKRARSNLKSLINGGIINLTCRVMNTRATQSEEARRLPQLGLQGKRSPTKERSEVEKKGKYKRNTHKECV